MWILFPFSSHTPSGSSQASQAGCSLLLQSCALSSAAHLEFQTTLECSVTDMDTICVFHISILRELHPHPQGLGRTYYFQWHFLILRTRPPVAGVASGSVLPAYPNSQLPQCNFQVPSDSGATPQPTFGVPDGCSLGPPNCSPFPFATRHPQRKVLI